MATDDPIGFLTYSVASADGEDEAGADSATSLGAPCASCRGAGAEDAGAGDARMVTFAGGADAQHSTMRAPQPIGFMKHDTIFQIAILIRHASCM
jgi:hypothetical protein